MMVVDASVLIAHLDATDAHHDRASSLLMDLADEPLAASPITVAEVLVGPVRAGQLDRATAALAQLQVTTVDLRADAPTGYVRRRQQWILRQMSALGGTAWLRRLERSGD